MTTALLEILLAKTEKQDVSQLNGATQLKHSPD